MDDNSRSNIYLTLFKSRFSTNFAPEATRSGPALWRELRRRHWVVSRAIHHQQKEQQQQQQHEPDVRDWPAFIQRELGSNPFDLHVV